MNALSTSGPGQVPTTSMDWLSPTLTVNVAGVNEVVHVVANKNLGSTFAGGANGLNVFPCYLNIDEGVLHPVGGGIYGVTVPQNTRIPIGVSGTFYLAPGTYLVGMCGQVQGGDAANWNFNEYGYVSAFVAHLVGASSHPRQHATRRPR